MKSLTRSFFALILLLATAHSYGAEKTARRICTAKLFRSNGVEAMPLENGLLYLTVSKTDDKVTLTKVVGHLLIEDYYAIFNGENLPEKPYVRAPSQYTNHYRFSLTATETAGSESGMWGHLIVNKDLFESNGRVDAHYVLQAGDHLGGTVDLECDQD